MNNHREKLFFHPCSENPTHKWYNTIVHRNKIKKKKKETWFDGVAWWLDDTGERKLVGGWSSNSTSGYVKEKAECEKSCSLILWLNEISKKEGRSMSAGPCPNYGVPAMGRIQICGPCQTSRPCRFHAGNAIDGRKRQFCAS